MQASAAAHCNEARRHRLLTTAQPTRGDRGVQEAAVHDQGAAAHPRERVPSGLRMHRDSTKLIPTTRKCVLRDVCVLARVGDSGDIKASAFYRHALHRGMHYYAADTTAQQSATQQPARS